MLEQWSRLRENDGNSSPLVAFILEDEGRDYKHGRLSYEQLNKYHTHKARFLQQQCIETRVCFWLARMSTSFDSRDDFSRHRREVWQGHTDGKASLQ